ncbi:MAG: NAD-dependent epimerase/dehydratase family protein, partial [Woeseiaceae bacterium]
LLTEDGHDVAILHRGTTSADLPGQVHHIRGNRNEFADAQPQVMRFQPDVVLDVIPYTESQARELVETFRRVAQRVVAVSSADVYRNYDGFRGQATAPPDPVPLCEDAPLRETRYPYRGYGLPLDWADDYDKILVEQIVLGEPSFPGTVLRLPAVYGPGDEQHRTHPYFSRMNAGRPAVFMGSEQAEWRWTRGYVGNVAAAIALAVSDDRAAGRIYNVGEESALTEREWAWEIGMAVGWSGGVIEVPAEHLPEHLRQPFDFHYDLATDTTRIRAELSFGELVGRKEALERTVQWERSQSVEPEQKHYAAEDDLLAAYRNAV